MARRLAAPFSALHGTCVALLRPAGATARPGPRTAGGPGSRAARCPRPAQGRDLPHGPRQAGGDFPLHVPGPAWPARRAGGAALLLLPRLVPDERHRPASRGSRCPEGGSVMGVPGTLRPARRATGKGGTRPCLGVLATHPIQYQAPLYQELSRRGVVELEV